MSLEVRIPLTLRLDPTLVGTGVGGELADAVEAATGRALAEMDRELIAPRGGYAWPRFNRPDFTWGGGLEDVSDAWRGDVEAEVLRALEGAITRSPDSSRDPLSRAPEVVPQNPSEWLDPRRLHGESYFVPSYDGDIPAPDQPVSLTRLSQNRGWLETHRLEYFEWTGSEAALADRLLGYLNDLPAGAVSSGPLGLFFTGSHPEGGLTHRIAVLNVNQATAGNVSARFLRSFMIGGFIQQSADQEEGQIVSVGYWSEAYITVLRSVQGVEDAQAAVRTDLFGRLNVSPEPVENEPRERPILRRFIHRFAANIRYAHPDGVVGKFEIPGRGFYYCSIPQQSFSGNALRILPVFAIGPRPQEEGGDGDAGGAGGQGEAGEGRGGGGQGDGGDGDGQGQGQGAGDGVGDGEGGRGGSGQRRGSPLADPDAEGGEGPSRFYPIGRGGEEVEINLGPFMGEPGLDELGDLAIPLRRLMRQIAFRLEMPMGKYAGSFCIAAAQMIGVRVSGVAGMAETTPRITRAVAPGSGNLGDVEMPPTRSPSITMIRYIAGTCPILTRLQHLVVETYGIERVADLITGRRQGNPVGWALDFYKSYTPEMKNSVGYLFIRSCQIKMLELLRNSKTEIDGRLNSFDTCYPMVRSMILGLIANEAELDRLRRQLSEAKANRGDFSASLAESYRSWREARHALTTSLSGQILNLSSLTTISDDTEGTIVETPQGLRIRDRHGRNWSEEDLEQAIAFRHGTAASIDPLIHQFRDIPEVVETFQRSPTLSRWYLRSLLEEMQSNNAEITATTISDDMFAFRAGKIREDLPQRTIPYTDLSLQGIHLMVHEAIGDAFLGDRSYALGVQYVMDVELGRQALIVFAETVSVIALAVICPPAAAALGAVYAGMHYADAAEIEQLYGSLIDPELILNRAEVEFDLFMAEFELALSIIPEAGSLVRGGVTATRTL